jgi:predicted RNase H-like HicB family nuclease
LLYNVEVIVFHKINYQRAFSMSTFVYQVECEQDTDGRWSATILELPGCSTWGNTKQEAIDSLKDATIAYLTTLAQDGRLVSKQNTDARYFDKAPVLAVDIKLPGAAA